MNPARILQVGRTFLCRTKRQPVHNVTACIMQSFIWYIFYSLKNTLLILYNEKWKIENCDCANWALRGDFVSKLLKLAIDKTSNA